MRRLLTTLFFFARYLAHRLLSEEQGGISGNYQVRCPLPFIHAHTHTPTHPLTCLPGVLTNSHPCALRQLMDMVQALKWVKAHIRGFGGDPDRVTVFGQSFGGSAMQHLMLSPNARGTYDTIISQSGGGVSDYSTQASWSFVAHTFLPVKALT